MRDNAHGVDKGRIKHQNCGLKNIQKVREMDSDSE